uniref:Ribosomal RNA small subunit methyltransferase NEP1 n=2 Tax=Kalanchoe fedtschenkoi TaxID=63787 RepID=A0A7N1A692_KALFE
MSSASSTSTNSPLSILELTSGFHFRRRSGRPDEVNFRRMGRPYGVKGKKRKNNEPQNEREASPDDEFIEQGDHPHAAKIQKTAASGNDEAGENGAVADQLPGIPLEPQDPTNNKNGVIFVLEKASLEVAKVGKGYQLLSAEDHTNFLKKNNKNPADYRPDIVHQALLTIVDSPLNKAGRLRAVYVRTQKGVLFEVKPNVRLPRTYKRFAGIMLQLLQKLSITAASKREKLLRVIKNPVTQYLPTNSRKIGFSISSQKSVTMSNYMNTVGNDENLVFVVGAMAHGKIDQEYTDDYVSISDYPLSAAWCIAEVCMAVQSKWKIH